MTEKSPSSVTSDSDASSSKHLTKNQIVMLVGASILFALCFLVYNFRNLSNKPLFTLPGSSFTPESLNQAEFSLKKFQSPEEFRQYLQEHSNSGGYGMSFFGGRGLIQDSGVSRLQAPAPVMMAQESSVVTANAGSAPSRVSETNVQVAGIDEADILKTNGRQIFLSTEGWYRVFNGGISVPPTERRFAPTSEMSVTPAMPAILPYPGPDYPNYQPGKTEILTAFPPADLARVGQIDMTGQLLLTDETLVVQGIRSNRGVMTGYDVSRPATPKQSWEIVFNDNNSVKSVRLKDNKIYLVMAAYLNNTECPIQPFIQTDGKQLQIACTDIYYPTRPASNVDTTYSAMIIDAKTGKVEKTTSIVGSNENSIFYMSPEALYLTYRAEPDMVEFLYGFVSAEGQGLFPATVISQLEKLRNYDISRQAKMVELQNIIESYKRSLSKDDQLRIENELQNKMETYMKQHSRELEQTMIVKFAASDLSTKATGQVPGFLLNQFSMDEYEGHLRVATTMGQGWTQFGRAESVSDVYILDGNLRYKGSVQDLGKTERIYSVRFLADKGYVVTFRETDPFYVLDLSNPSRPEKKGELKIPGYSSYLHPIGKDRVVGIGKENNNVKISLFDVSNPADPREASKYQLDEYWSELLSNHHAFLIDEKHKVFFMPGSKGGYVFSYDRDNLSLVKAISQSQVKRALFINDFLYVLGEQGITVLDEKNWQVVKEFSL
jgi:inhibitor of cysteine peptidase